MCFFIHVVNVPLRRCCFFTDRSGWRCRGAAGNAHVRAVHHLRRYSWHGRISGTTCVPYVATAGLNGFFYLHNLCHFSVGSMFSPCCMYNISAYATKNKTETKVEITLAKTQISYDVSDFIMGPAVACNQAAFLMSCIIKVLSGNPSRCSNTHVVARLVKPVCQNIVGVGLPLGFQGAWPGGSVWGGPALPHLGRVPEGAFRDGHRRRWWKSPGVLRERRLPCTRREVSTTGWTMGIRLESHWGTVWQ